MKNRSLFSLGNTFNPFYLLDKYLNPFTHSQRITLSDNPVNVAWTNRANNQMSRNKEITVAEMQLYFSCVVKKRVIFNPSIINFETTTVNNNLKIAFNTVEAASCDPVEFAMHYPAKRILDSDGALKMKPRELRIDYKHNQWTGEFII